MLHWKLTLAYDGTPFHGWQIQPGLPTVQGELSDAIHRTVGERVLPQGSGRTDAGVHALAQVASLSLKAPIPPAKLRSALNRCLPPSIRVLSAETVSGDFHARHSALRKTYEYRIFPLKSGPLNARAGALEADQRICPPMLAPFVWPCLWRLDLDSLNAASAQVVGEHDFLSFAASDPDLAARTVETTEYAMRHFHNDAQVANLESDSGIAHSLRSAVRNISHSRWHAEGDLLIYRVTANGFLHHMVRNLVGTFVQCGARRLAPDAVPGILAARNRSAAGPTAPATGLFLLSVEYPPSTLELETPK